jgi:hypothetical protein
MTVSWLEFIVQMSNAWAWPTVTIGALVFLRKPIKLAATGIVARVGDIRRLKAPWVDVEFEKEARELAETTDEQRSLPPTTAGELTLPPESTDERFAKYQDIVTLNPDAAVLASFAELESLIRQEFERHFPDQNQGRYVPFGRVLKLLASEGFILGDVVVTIQELSQLRNRVAHHDTRIDANSADYYVRAIRNVISNLQFQNFFGEPNSPSAG